VERTLKILSFVFIAIAFFFVWRGDVDAVFVSGVIGACCFFLSMRYEIQARRDRRDAAQRAGEKGENG
jgi:hypothetical protein